MDINAKNKQFIVFLCFAMLDGQALYYGRDGMQVFAPLSFQLSPGQCLRIAGANGQGKTTLLRILAGLLSFEGKTTWQHVDLAKTSAAFRSQYIYVGHKHDLHPGLTLRENLELALALRGIEDKPLRQERVTRALKAADLMQRQHQRISTLSAGLTKRVALLRLLLQPAGEVSLWLLDEPFVHLDAETQTWFARHCVSHLAAGGMMIFTSHQSQSSWDWVHDTIALEPGQRVKTELPQRMAQDAHPMALKHWLTLCRYEGLIQGRNLACWLQRGCWLILVLVIYHLSLGDTSSSQLGRLAETLPASMVWVAVLLLMTQGVSTDGLSQQALWTQRLTSPLSLRVLVAANSLLATCCILGLVLICLPFVWLLTSIPLSALWLLGISLLLGVPSLVILTMCLQALTQGAAQRGILLGLMMLPLSLPVLMWSFMAVQSGELLQVQHMALALLAALAVVSQFFGPWLLAAVQRMSMDE